MKTQAKSSLLKSSAATFYAQLPQNRGLTLPDFNHAQTMQFKKSADNFARALIQLWTSGDASAQARCDVAWQTLDFYSLSPRTVHHQFKDGQSKNLGALAFLNMLLANPTIPESLGVLLHLETNDFYFTQRAGSFWADYHTPSLHHDFLTTERSLEQALTRSLSTHNDAHAAWWQSAVQEDIHMNQIFQLEIFETALRIFLTPTSMLEHLGQAIVKQSNLDFEHYFFRKINLFKTRFVTMLSDLERMQWLGWLTRHGPYYVEGYMRYVAPSPFGSEFMQAIVQNAIELDIPKLHHLISSENMRAFSLTNKAQLFDYCIEQFEEHWQALAHQPTDALWHFTEALAASLDEELKQTSSQISIDRAIKPFLGHFIMTCMSLEKHTLVNFLLAQDDTLVHVPIRNSSTLLADDKPWGNHSLLYFAQQKKYPEMVALLQSKGARLLTIEASGQPPESQTSKKHQFKRRASFLGLPKAYEELPEPTHTNPFLK
ncbi:MAG: hypothetical protein P1U39_05705 [Legionellaceae bacterium]|nr:hypothetical protein [Legionellaceae bacterium]